MRSQGNRTAAPRKGSTNVVDLAFGESDAGTAEPIDELERRRDVRAKHHLAQRRRERRRHAAQLRGALQLVADPDEAWRGEDQLADMADANPLDLATTLADLVRDGHVNLATTDDQAA